MNVKELIKKLEKIEDKNLYVGVIIPDKIDNVDTNYWISDVEISNKGDSGYELHGEARLIGRE